MELFVRKHEKKINGTLGCFDRMLFRGYLPIQSGWAMACFLNQYPGITVSKPSILVRAGKSHRLLSV